MLVFNIKEKSTEQLHKFPYQDQVITEYAQYVAVKWSNIAGAKKVFWEKQTFVSNDINIEPWNLIITFIALLFYNLNRWLIHFQHLITPKLNMNPLREIFTHLMKKLNHYLMIRLMNLGESWALRYEKALIYSNMYIEV